MIESINLKLAKVKSSNKLRKIIRYLKKVFGENDPGIINFDFTDKPSRMLITQEIISRKNYKSYLEIGTFDDELFKVFERRGYNFDT